jgi:hypothetical protein
LIANRVEGSNGFFNPRWRIVPQGIDGMESNKIAGSPSPSGLSNLDFMMQTLTFTDGTKVPLQEVFVPPVEQLTRHAAAVIVESAPWRRDMLAKAKETAKPSEKQHKRG